jgi:hypothetical protein
MAILFLVSFLSIKMQESIIIFKNTNHLMKAFIEILCRICGGTVAVELQVRRNDGINNYTVRVNR